MKRGISVKFLGKICLMIILKVTKNKGFTKIDPPPKLFTAFIELKFRCCFLTWIFHSRSLNNKINQLHEKALRIMYWN